MFVDVQFNKITDSCGALENYGNIQSTDKKKTVLCLA